MEVIGENIPAADPMYKSKDVLFGRSPALMREGMMIN
jgi:hypothetical protein